MILWVQKKETYVSIIGNIFLSLEEAISVLYITVWKLKFVWKMESVSFLASTNHLVKINMSLNIFVHLDTLMDHINNELSLLALFLLEILMLNYQNGTIMILPMQMVVHLMIPHYQQDIKKLSTNYILILHTIHFLALISNFVII